MLGVPNITAPLPYKSRTNYSVASLNVLQHTQGVFSSNPKSTTFSARPFRRK